MKKHLCFLILLCGVFRLSAQVSVSSLQADSLAELPLNRFFYFSPEPYRDAVSQEICVKTDANIDTFLQAISRTLSRETQYDPDSSLRIWEQPPFPGRFFVHHDLLVQIDRRKSYQLLRFYTTTSRAVSERGKRNAKQTERRLGVSALEYDYLQRLLNQQRFDAPEKASFNLGSSAYQFYLSRQEAAHIGLDTLYEFFRYPPGETGGMHNNASLSRITLGPDQVRQDWAPMEIEESVPVSLATLIDQAEYLNGTFYELKDSKLTTYGTGGYGSHIRYDLYYFGDSLSVRLTVDEASDDETCLTVNYYQSLRDPDMQVSYGCFADDELPDFEEDYPALQAYLQNLDARLARDTVLFHKGLQGALISIAPTVYQMRQQGFDRIPKVAALEPLAADAHPESAIYQLYVGREPMEDYFQSYLGFLPAVLLIEIYARGTLIFKWDATNRKYYHKEPLILD